jgi:hypothetical protein
LAEFGLVVGSLCALIIAAAAWVYSHGYILYYGDAQAHLDISRSIVDSRTPGYDQLGTVWLPILHIICLPFVGRMSLWSDGLAGTIPVAICFVVAGTFFYYAARDAYQSSLMAAIVLACFAVNPNILYLAAIPMTEIVFFAGLAMFLFALLRFRQTQNRGFTLLGLFASWSMCLTRYDGWFLIPFSALAFALVAERRRFIIFIGFGVAAALAPLYWLAHNWWETSNPLDFYNGPYSAAAIQGNHTYPGYHDWKVAIEYYAAAARSSAGLCLIGVGALGIACAVYRKARALTPLLFLLLTPVFYVWSIHSAKLPVRVPQLWPHDYYNTRYGTALIPLAAFAVGAVVLMLPRRARRFAPLLVLLVIAPWLLHPSRENWICWKESQKNSVARRIWTEQAASYFTANYQRGTGILAPFGDLTGIFCRARIPLAEILHEGNGPAWALATSRPDLYHPAAWAVAQQNDFLSRALNKPFPSSYVPVQRIQANEAPILKIYNRSAP